LTRHEAHRLGTRRAVLRWGSMAGFAGFAATLMLCPAYKVPVLIAVGVGCFALHVRAALCPRCGHNLFVPRDVAPYDREWDDADGGGLAPLPACCRACGVGLAPDAEPGAAADGGGM
jgi:hypothetical protein